MQAWLELALWGLLGGGIVDGLEFWREVRTNGGRCPEEFRTMAYLVAEAIRLGVGAVLAVAFGLHGQVTAPLGALAIGVAAPLIVEKMSKQLPKLPSEGGGQ